MGNQNFHAARARGVVLELLSRTAKVAKIAAHTTGSSACAITLSLLLFCAAAANAASVKDFGAKGDGVTDDTSAIQNAVNLTSSGTLLFPGGTYKISNTIYLLSNVTYQGQNAKLQGNGYFWLMETAWNAANITIQGFTFDSGGLDLNGTVTGLTLTGNTFQNLTTDNSGGNWTLTNAVFAGSGGLRSSKISGNKFTNLIVAGSSTGDYHGNQALWFYGLDSTSIDHNTFDHINEAIKVCLDNKYQSNNIYIGHNTFTNIHRMGMEIQGAMGCGESAPAINGPDTYNMVIEYNSFTQPLKPYWWTYPISLANPAPTGGSGAIVRYNYIVSALPDYGMSGPTGYGIEGMSAYLQIYGNTLAGPWQIGITYDGAPNSTIHDNFLCGLAPGASMNIAVETSPSPNVSIANNTIDANSCPATLPNPIAQTPPSTPVANGTYTLTNVWSNLSMDDPAYSVKSGTQLIQWQANGGNNQKWVLTFDGSGHYTVMNDFSGLYLTDVNGQAQEVTQNNADTQKWTLQAAPGSSYVLVNKSTGKALDDNGKLTTNGNPIITWSANGGQNQNWIIK
jgi:Pectate lyase superfamily protein/Ricin-type beta-trefoil lectin domain-like